MGRLWGAATGGRDNGGDSAFQLVLELDESQAHRTGLCGIWRFGPWMDGANMV
jgi:hypothetical protein